MLTSPGNNKYSINAKSLLRYKAGFILMLFIIIVGWVSLSSEAQIT